MLKLFGFPYVTAPGEAEAECALLQREGVVDAVLSEDVDTLMFGSTLTLRNWSCEGTRGSKAPTHVNCYYAQATKEGQAGLDRPGMILVALMSGGDYITAGISGCGIKVACEAARAGFGHDLIKIQKNDKVSLNQWRERLQYELQTNESGYFRTRHKSWIIPNDFPNKTVLSYYTHPVVSSAEKVADLGTSITWHTEPQIMQLRAFAADAFEWQGLSGANKFIRGMAPALLAHRLCKRSLDVDGQTDDLSIKADQEAKLVKAIYGMRKHFSTDGIPELRISYIPSEMVGLDLSQEESETYTGEVINDSSDAELEYVDGGNSEENESPRKRGPSRFDPEKLHKSWLLETVVKLGVPLTVETWEEDMRNPKKFATRKSRERQAALKGGMRKGAMETYVRITKPVSSQQAEKSTKAGSVLLEMEADPFTATGSHVTQNRKKQPSLGGSTRPQKTVTRTRGETATVGMRKDSDKTIRKPGHQGAQANSPRTQTIDPWTMANRLSDSIKQDLPDSNKIVSLLSSSPLHTPSPAKSFAHASNRSAHQSPLDSTVGYGEKDWAKSPKLPPVNRRLSFDSPKPLRSTHELSESPSLPPLISSTTKNSRKAREKGSLIITLAHRPENKFSTRYQKKTIVIRESLDGAWKEVEAWEVKGMKPGLGFTNVEVLDLTGV
ncbi:hypothetical protein MMC25_007503 [Agyrium rufum]|nr:hypothetical protein [Agyrium rufum]